MSSAVQSKIDYPVLTGVRAIAATFVYFHHLRWTFPGFVGDVFIHFSKEAHVGVTIFYVLSGFVISHGYFDSARINGPWLKKYFWNRFIRIFPAYWLVLFLCYIIIEPTWDLKFWLLNASLFKSFFPSTIFLGLPQAWSLGVELCFYLIAPFVFVFIRQRSAIPKLVLGVFIFELVIFAIWKAAEVLHFGAQVPWVFLYFYTLSGRAFEFSCGIFLAHWMKRREKTSSAQRAGSIFTFRALAGCMLVVGLMALLHKSEPAASIFWPEGAFLNNAILPIPIALLFFGLMTEQTWIRRVFLTPMFQFLGKSSYAFYLIHAGVLSSYLLSQVGSKYYWINFLTLQLVAALIYFIFENPIHRYFRNNRAKQLSKTPELGLQ